MERRGELLRSAKKVRKVELRDFYAVDTTSYEAWKAGDRGAVALKVAQLRNSLTNSPDRDVQRIKIVSEPLSDYQRYVLKVVTGTLVEAGEDIRYLPRRLTSTVLLPGNDFFVIDDRFVVFNVLDGHDDRAEQQLHTDERLVERCGVAFDEAWQIAIPYAEYNARQM